MSGRKLLRRFSSSISDLLSLQRKDINDDLDKSTPLHDAVQMGNFAMVSNFVESKTVWIDEEDGKGRTALHYAMEQCNSEIASILLKGGANVDCVDYEGTSACHIACKEGMIDHFNLLLYYHVDVCAIDKIGRTPFDMACEYGQEKMMERLLSSGICIDILKNCGDTHFSSALHLAAANGHVQIVAKLLENGWDINRVNHLGSALHVASGYGKTQVVRFLIRAGIDINLLNSQGQTAAVYSKKNSAKNPITYKEIRYLLKNCKHFVNGIAVSEFSGAKADELSFSPGDRIWVIERSEEAIWKGIVFGQKGNSRSGYFQSKTIVIDDKKSSLIDSNISGSMSSLSQRLAMPPQHNVNHGRNSAKPVPLPTVPTLHTPNRSDLNRNSPGMMSSFGRAPSGLSDTSSDSNNGNRRLNSFGHKSTFSSYGTDTASMLNARRSNGTNGSTSMLPSTSNNPMGLTANTSDFHRTSTGSNSSNGSSGFESLKCSTSSTSSTFLQTPNTNDCLESNQCRNSLHSTGSGSGSSSIGSSSIQTLDDSFHSASTAQIHASVNVSQMLHNGVPQGEILANWLDNINMSEYLSIFLKQGYDLFSIARCTPEDLLSLGIKIPDHRKKLIAEIHSWHITDNWPNVIPIGGLREWLQAISLAEYIPVFENQGYCTVQDILTLTWEDFEDIGVKRLGHLKRIGLAIKKIKDYRKNMPPLIQNKSMHVPNNNYSSSMLSHNIDSLSQSMRHDPPPPAPSGNFQPKMDVHDRIDYFSYSRGGAKAAPPPPVRQPVPLEKRQNVRSSFDSLFTTDGPIRLNLVSAGKILSDLSKVNNDAPQPDLSYFDSHSDCPPPPAPLYSEANPLKFLTMKPSNGSNGSGSSIDQLPFANENCGTIKSSKGTGLDYPMILPPVFSSSNSDRTDADIAYEKIDEMMKSLVGELDTMILSNKKKETTAAKTEEEQKKENK